MTQIDNLLNAFMNRRGAIAAATLATGLLAGSATVAQADSSLWSSCPSHCTEGCEPVSPYPFVFVHGAVGTAESFDTVRSELKETYGDQCKTIATAAVEVAKFQSPEVRGADLAVEIFGVLMANGGGKVHLVAHSAGSRDVRYYAAHERELPFLGPQVVASVTTVAGDGSGVIVADVMTGIYEAAPRFWDAVDEFVASPIVYAFFEATVDGDFSPTDVTAALLALNSDGSRRFECDHPNVPGIPYARHGGRIRHVVTTVPSQLLLAPIWAFLELLGFENDGLLTVGTAHGDGISDYWEEHDGFALSIGVNHFALIDAGEVWGFQSHELFETVVEFAIGNIAPNDVQTTPDCD